MATRRIAGSLLALVLTVAGISASAETLMGKVVGVHDGDTLVALVRDAC